MFTIIMLIGMVCEVRFEEISYFEKVLAETKHGFSTRINRPP